MPRKRAAESSPNPGRVQKKVRPTSSALKETSSIAERTEPFRLMTVKFPIDDTTPKWSTGCNREIDQRHVKDLCRIFEENGLQRLDRTHRLCLLCSAEDVRRMCEHLGIKFERNDPSATLPSFQGWSGVTGGVAAEVLAGNHRIEALKAHLKENKLAEKKDERWWACDIFDSHTLPPDLQIELRANRSGTVLPDSHGQIWTELCAYAGLEQGRAALSGSREEVEARISRALQLNTREKFPVRRLAILWRNHCWRRFVTRLCTRRVGKDLFNVTMFQNLSGCRIDDYLFERLRSIMKPVNKIWDNFKIELELEKDYPLLRQLYQTRKPLELFYPRERDVSEVDLDSLRRPRFLTHVDDSKYLAFFQGISEIGHAGSLPDAQKLLQNLKSHCKTMQMVMKHVVMWLNNGLVSVKDREGNKPALVEELCSVSSMLGTAPQDGPRLMPRSRALELQQSVLQFVEENAEAFAKDDLSFFPLDGVEPDKYQERFRLEAWREVLSRVQNAGGKLCNPCVSGFVLGATGQQPAASKRSIAAIVCDAIMQDPELVPTPTLRTSQSKLALQDMIERTVALWQQGRWDDPEDPELVTSLSQLSRFRDDSMHRTTPIGDQNGSASARTTKKFAGKQAARQEHAGLFVRDSDSEEATPSLWNLQEEEEDEEREDEGDDEERVDEEREEGWVPSSTQLRLTQLHSGQTRFTQLSSNLARSGRPSSRQTRLPNASSGPSGVENRTPPSAQKPVSSGEMNSSPNEPIPVQPVQRRPRTGATSTSGSRRLEAALTTNPLSRPHFKSPSSPNRAVGAGPGRQRHGWRAQPVAKA